MKVFKWKYTVIHSFLKRERERTVNVILQSFLTVYLVQYDRFIPFTVPDRPPFLTVTDHYHDRYHDRFWAFLSVLETVRNGQERSGTVMVTVRNGQERWAVWNDHTVQNKRSETIAKSRSRCVHGTFTFTFQKRKNHCTVPERKPVIW